MGINPNLILNLHRKDLNFLLLHIFVGNSLESILETIFAIEISAIQITNH